MSSDLVQLRWQFLRTTEALQVTENENLKLRREILDLKNAPVVVVSQDDTVEKIKLRKHCHGLKAFAMRLQADILRIRLSAVQEINAASHERHLLQLSFENMHKILRSKDALTDGLISEKLQMTKQLNELRQRGADSSNSLLKDIARLKSEQNELQLQLMEQKSIQSNMANEIIKQKSASEEQQEQYANIKAELQKSNSECQRLKEVVVQTEMTGAQRLDEAYRQKQEMQDYYEKIIEELGFENNYLRATCSEQEAQIARLTNSLIGNKSHFAKYVEVKTENLSLQHKLETIEKSKRGSGTSRTFGQRGVVLNPDSHTNRLAASSTEQLAATLAAAAQSTSHGNHIVSMAQSGGDDSGSRNLRSQEDGSVGGAAGATAGSSQDSMQQTNTTAQMLPARQRRMTGSRLANAGVNATNSSPSKGTMPSATVAFQPQQHSAEHHSPQTSPRQQESLRELSQRQQLLQENINDANIAMNMETTAQTIRKIKERTAVAAAAGYRLPKTLRFDDSLPSTADASKPTPRHHLDQRELRTSASATTAALAAAVAAAASESTDAPHMTAVAVSAGATSSSIFASKDNHLLQPQQEGKIGGKVASFLDEKRQQHQRRTRNSFASADANGTTTVESNGRISVGSSTLASIGGSKLTLGTRYSNSAKAGATDKMKI